jgi:hypothetical protein
VDGCGFHLVHGAHPRGRRLLQQLRVFDLLHYSAQVFLSLRHCHEVLHRVPRREGEQSDHGPGQDRKVYILQCKTGLTRTTLQELPKERVLRG